MTTRYQGDSVGTCVTMNNLDIYHGLFLGIVVFVYSDFEVCFCSPTHSTLASSRRRIIPSSIYLCSVVLI